MIAQAEHIPVHLGAMPEAVAAVMRNDPAPNDVWVLNDPYTGGTHLPDITLVSRTALGFAVSRAHHADVGGIEPASLPAFSTDLSEEGIVIPPTRLDGDTLELIARTSRNPDERRADLRAQLAAHRLAEQRSLELVTRRGREKVECGHGRALRLLRETRPGGHRRASGRSVRGRGRDRGGRRRPRDPLRRHGRRGGGRDRLCGDGAATPREPQLSARGDPLCLLLRRALP